jgi:ATP-dependent RNA circularization protein (DNA/RNA ligase family)
MEFFKFPRTPHLFVDPELDIRDDKILSVQECESFLNNSILLEEKVDGANIGISLSEKGELLIQNRGNYIIPGSHPQFNRLWDWAYSRVSLFNQHIANNFMIFGEWCYAKHSIQYTSLPDWFLGFDVFDKKNQTFLNTNTRNQILQKLNIETIPLLGKGIYSKIDLEKLLASSKSKFYSGPVEGIYLRYEDSERLLKRAKLVKKEFIKEIDVHWSKKEIISNKIQSL